MWAILVFWPSCRTQFYWIFIIREVVDCCGELTALQFIQWSSVLFMFTRLPPNSVIAAVGVGSGRLLSQCLLMGGGRGVCWVWISISISYYCYFWGRFIVCDHRIVGCFLYIIYSANYMGRWVFCSWHYLYLLRHRTVSIENEHCDLLIHNEWCAWVAFMPWWISTMSLNFTCVHFYDIYLIFDRYLPPSIYMSLHTAYTIARCTAVS